MRLSVVAACLSLCLIGFATANDAHASIRKDTNIPAEGLGPALNALARDRNFQIVYVTEEIANLRTAGATGLFTTEEALKRLLIGTGLSYRYLDDRTVTILPMGSVAPQEQAAATAKENQGGDVSDPKEGKKSSSGEFRVAQVDQGKSASASSVGNQPSNSQESSNSPSAGLSEIIVTAQKRAERLQDVPVPVSVISAQSLLENNQTSIQDYYMTVPGLSVAPRATSIQALSIRGISTGNATNPTVAVLVDDAPFGSATYLQGNNVPDLDPSDLQRIEVLRGPQGTLYGASSVGGLVKFVTVDPSMDALSGRVQVDTDKVANGSDLGYGVRGSINVPLGDTFALRASGFTRQDPGYINNPVLGIDGINKTDAYGGHVAALWRPSDNFSIKLSALWQEIKADGSSDVDVENPLYPATTGLQGLEQNYVRGVGGYERKVQAYSATIHAKLGDVDLTSVSGYNIGSSHDSFDYSFAYGAIFNQLFGVGGVPVVTDAKTEKFSQEVRASMPLGDRVTWLVGAYYTHENSPYAQGVWAANPSTGEFVLDTLHTTYPTTYEEYAGFTDVTLKFTDRFDVQMGAREGQIRQTDLEEVAEGPLAGGTVTTPEASAKSSAFTYLFTPRFRLSTEWMVYGRIASGYQPSGANIRGAPFDPQEPRSYSSSKTYNYEIGAKGSAFDNLLTIDSSLYYIDWKDVQVTLIDPISGTTYITNGSGAKSEGLELSAILRPVQGLTVSGWIDWGEAILTEKFPPGGPGSAVGFEGDRLPNSTRLSGNLSAGYEFPISASTTGTFGVTESYVGNRIGEFIASSNRQYYPPYARTDFHAGVKIDTWAVNLFLNNAFDRRGVINGGVGLFPPFAFNYIQPRTLGLSVAKSF